jgi:hypothetical protein
MLRLANLCASAQIFSVNTVIHLKRAVLLGLRLIMVSRDRSPWAEHFSWSRDGLRIVGLTAIGRATSNRLDMNDDEHDDGSIIRARRLWQRGGWHPPATDPILQE